jgi:hypothetical protein
MIHAVGLVWTPTPPPHSFFLLTFLQSRGQNPKVTTLSDLDIRHGLQEFWLQYVDQTLFMAPPTQGHLCEAVITQRREGIFATHSIGGGTGLRPPRDPPHHTYRGHLGLSFMAVRVDWILVQ